MTDEELERFREAIRNVSDDLDHLARSANNGTSSTTNTFSGFDRLSKKSSELTDSLKRQQDSLDKNKAQQDVYTVALKKSTDGAAKEELARLKNEAALTRGTMEYERQMERLGLVRNVLGEYERVVTTLTDAQRKQIAQEEEISKNTRAKEDLVGKAHEMLANKSRVLIDGLSAFGSGLNKTLFDSTKGQSKYGEVMGGFGDGIIKATENLGPLGKAAGLAAGGLFKLVGAAFKQQEQLNKAYEKLSEFGAVDVSGIEGMFKNLQNMGMTIAEIDKFGDVLKSAGPNLATLGTTTADGAKVFAETMGKIKNTGVEKELRQLGFTSETMTKTFADYQGMMGRQGFIQGKSTAEIAKQSSEYAKTLDQLAKLTGESRDELQKRMDADANDMKFRLKTQEMERSGNKEGADRLRKASALVADFGEDTASGFREMIANNGAVVGEASTKLMLSTGNAAKQIVEDLNAGKISHLEAAKLIAEAKEKQVERFREVGKLDNDLMRELGITVKDMDAINKYRNKTQKDLEDIELNQKLQAKGDLDAQRAAEVTRQMTERNMEQSKDRLINMVGKQMVGAFETLMKMVNNVAKQLAHFLKWLGGPDFTDLFMSTEDIKSNLDKTTSELDKTNKQIESINSAKDRYLQKDKELLEKNKQIDELTVAYSKETNAEKKKEMNEQLKQARMDRATLDAEARQARQDFNRQQTLLPKLQSEKAKLEQQKIEQTTKLEQAGGTMAGAEKESPEVKKLKEEAEKISDERAKLTDVIEDKSKILYKQTLEKLKMSEEELKDEEKRKKFEQSYADSKKEYMDRRTSIDKRLIAIGDEKAKLDKEELDRSKQNSASTTGVAGPAGSGPKSSMGGYLQKIAQIESTGKATATNEKSSAAGLFQFTVPTWKQMTKEMGKDYSLEDRFDPKKSAEVAAFFTAKQSGQLEKALGRTPNDTELYMAHFLGAGGAIKFLSAMSRSPGAPSTEGADDKQIAANKPIFYEEAGKGKLRSLQEVYALMNSKVEKAGATIAAGKGGEDIAKIQTARSGGLMSGPESGYPVLLHGKEVVIPMPNAGDLANTMDSVSKTPLESMQPTATAQTSMGNQSMMDQFMTLQTDLMNMIANKLDALDSRLAKSNDIQSDILTYSAA